MEGFEKAEKFVVCEQGWDEEGRSERDDSPKDEADAIICKKVILFCEKGFGAFRL